MSGWLTWMDIWLRALGPGGFALFLLMVVGLGAWALYLLSRRIDVPDEAPLFDTGAPTPFPGQTPVIHETLRDHPSATTGDFLYQVQQEQIRLRALLIPAWLAFPCGTAGRCPVCGALVHDDDVLLHTEWHVRGAQ